MSHALQTTVLFAVLCFSIGIDGSAWAQSAPPLELGKVLGAGAEKVAFEVVGRPNWVALQAKPDAADGETALLEERPTLLQARAMGFAVPATLPLVTVEGRLTLPMRRFAAAHKTSEFLDFVSDKTFKSMERFNLLVRQTHVAFGDLGFLVHSSGKLVLHDLMSVESPDKIHYEGYRLQPQGPIDFVDIATEAIETGIEALRHTTRLPGNDKETIGESRKHHSKELLSNLKGKPWRTQAQEIKNFHDETRAMTKSIRANSSDRNPHPRKARGPRHPR